MTARERNNKVLILGCQPSTNVIDCETYFSLEVTVGALKFTELSLLKNCKNGFRA